MTRLHRLLLFAGLLAVCMAVIAWFLISARGPVPTVRTFLQALRSGDNKTMGSLVTPDSMPIVHYNIEHGNHGIAYLVRSPLELTYGRDYTLQLVHENRTRASVRLRFSAKVLRGALAGLPPELRKKGIPFSLEKKSGAWRINLFETEWFLYRISMQRYDWTYTRPGWVPDPPGMPPVPGGGMPRPIPGVNGE